MQKDFLAVTGLSQGLDLKRSGTKLTMANQTDLGIELRKMLHNFEGSGHPIFRCTSPVERGQLRSKQGGKTTIHFNGSTENIELLLQMVISVNQLSLYGALADMIAQLTIGQRAPEKPGASGELHKQEILTQPPLAELQANEERQGNLLQEYEQRFEKSSEDQKLSRLCSEAGLGLAEVGQFFYALPSPRGEGYQSLCREYTLPRDQKRNSNKRMDPMQCTIWLCLGHKSLQYTRKTQYCSILVQRSNRILD